MKINEYCILKFFNINSKKILKLLDKSGLEVNNVIKTNNNIYKIISGKIIDILYLKDEEYLIKLNISKLKYITIKQNIKYDNYLKNSIVALIFFNKNKKVYIYTPKILEINNNNDPIILNKNTKLGIDLSYLLIFNFNIIDIKIPNNRLDCLNILGICKEISIINNIKINLPFNNIKINPSIDKKFFINIIDKNICSKYCGFYLEKIEGEYNTPIEIKEKLIHSDFKINNNINDIINYIFLETGYLINIFNIYDIYDNEIIIKLTNNDSYYLVNNKNVFIYRNTLSVFNNNNEILNIPGIDIKKNINNYNNIFIGCGSFNYKFININKNLYNNTNHFVENNEIEVEYNLIYSILKYFIKILSNIYKINYSYISKSNLFNIKKYINLNIYKLYKFIGFKIKYENIINILNKLKFKFSINSNNTLKVVIPKTRSDINIKEDLFEEIIKIYGCNKIPKYKKSVLNNNLNNIYLNKLNNKEKIIYKIKKFLIYNGFNEVISYSLVNKNKQNLIYKNNQIDIINPISENMSSFRRSLLIGLLNIIKFNEDRQENNIKIFEHGFCFNYLNNIIVNNEILSGIIYGNKKNDFFKIKSNESFDFYDIKGNVEDILLFFFNKHEFLFVKNKKNNIFDLNQSLKILNIKENIIIGYFGYINNNIIKIFKLKNNVIFFEIYINNININKNTNINKIYNTVINKRDISVTINNNINIYKIINYLNNIKNNQTIKLNLIDYYKEDNINNNFTIRFYIQDKYKTLTYFDIENIVNFYILKLKNKFKIIIKN
ncbi:phenylalanine--tRNA ligase beta subunit-related protein [endosymbiont of Pachyrhynchus infernalis]|uniref:phenylalanine--tRNA ligase beta subunit-related protein n=1 Tax=endosymbiont of Pachyrhynchus infernalis TaxID=1971488 RepID=UPI000DC71DBD|nr:phenylalanine--tRNA ligase beta subunit-related protein [endosymbiont of Pachyrhynchus infernalis]BBA84863.1 phenylalanine--tRNA ligase beta subunit [endosymbiont of Pachyrhynchus infernalis]